MKTETRSQILEIIDKNGKIKPSELQKSLNITPQAVHYHLRNLIKQGLIEAKGSVPHTQYMLAGIPDLTAVSIWLNARSVTKNPEEVCETRDIFASRLPRLKSLTKSGLTEELLPLIIIAAGETGNNSFDHNLGQWRDVPGCWFESQITGSSFWICIADRGQGVYQSLHRVHPELADDQAALKAAFETIISGRSPEQRGNGLKFVREIYTNKPGAGLACMSGTGRVNYGEQGEKCMALLDKNFKEVKGTITLMTWRLQ